jgi:hypothetical protein
MKICALAKPFNEISNCIENEVSVKPQFNVAAPASALHSCRLKSGKHVFKIWCLTKLF